MEKEGGWNRQRHDKFHLARMREIGDHNSIIHSSAWNEILTSHIHLNCYTQDHVCNPDASQAATGQK